MSKEPGPYPALDTLLMSGVKPIPDNEPEDEYSGGNVFSYVPIPYCLVLIVDVFAWMTKALDHGFLE